MPVDRLRTIFFSALLLGVLLLTFFIFSPYLITLSISATLAVIVHPAYLQLVKELKGHETIAAILTITITSIVILLPLTFVTYQVVLESTDLYRSLSSNQGTTAENFIQNIESHINRFIPQFPIDIDKYLGSMFSWLASHIGSIFASTLETVFHIFLAILALFYMLRDGNKFLKEFIAISPLSEQDDKKILTRLQIAINSVIKGSLSIAVLQGLSTGIGLAIFGVPSPILWGSIAAVGAMVPSVGTMVILVPAVIYLFLSDNLFGAVGLTIWGSTAVGLIDNFLGPILVGRGIRIHPFFILFSVLGGLTMFGPFGFVLGPLTLSLLFALLDIYKHLRGRSV